MIDSFTDFVIPFCGGLILCLSTSIHLLFKGRVTGMSGIFHGLITLEKASLSWRITFVGSMMITGAIAWYIQTNNLTSWVIYDPPEAVVSDLNLGGFFLAGLFVGFGTKLSNGCTSGHGVCGLPRFSVRSWVATPVFVALGIGIASLRYHKPFLMEFQATDWVLNTNMTTSYSVFLVIFSLIIIALFIKEYHDAYAHNKEQIEADRQFKKKARDIVITFVVGTLFAIGLLIGGMCKRTKILGFLAINSEWDISLLFVLLGAVLGNLVTFHLILKHNKKPICEEKFGLVNSKVIDWKLVGGAASFGFGWGIGGLCPGPGYILFPMVTPQVTLLWFPGLAVGQMCAKYLEKYTRKPNKVATQKTMY